jgi:uncharacterized protein YyaL (SSP411 family)
VELATGAEDEQTWPLIAGRAPAGGQARVYVCRAQTCLAPIDDVESLVKALRPR